MKKVRLCIYSMVLVVGLIISSTSVASELVGPRNIVSVGCHNGSGTCFITLDGASFGGSLGCANGPINQFRFDNGDTDDGKRSFAAFLAAYLNGKRTTVYLDGCTTQGYPQLIYYTI